MLKFLKYIFFIKLLVFHLSVALVTNDTWYCGEEENIPLSKVCDGKVDCANGRDETAKACILNICKDDQYRCAYGGCIHVDTKCDKEIHCIDRSDETEHLCESEEKKLQKIHGHCTDEEYQCESGECIAEFNLCDGRPDCSDASDETVSSCAHVVCPDNSFRCGYGACIGNLQVCDKIWDCKDGSDELCSMSWEVIEPQRKQYKPKVLILNTTCAIPYENVHLQVIHSKTKQIFQYFDKIVRNDEVEFKCSPGFALTGVNRLSCTDNTWYRQWPNCTRSIKTPSCRSNEAACDNGDCIHKELLCNGIKNCKDGSDETARKCLNRTCASSEFQCKYGACIHTRLICDDVTHCADSSDETRLLCTQDEDESFKILQGGCNSTDDEVFAGCRSGQCIPLYLVCDGKPDCADRSDETVEMCAHMNCTNASFTCAYGACVSNTVHCDGRMDCADGSDEIAEICATIEAARAKREEELNFNDNYISNIEKNEAAEEYRIYSSMQEDNDQDNADARSYDRISTYRYCTIPADRAALRAKMGNEALKIGSRVNIGTIVKFICDEPWQPFKKESELLCMPHGVWSGAVPKCQKRCPPLSKGISKRMVCNYNRKEVDCAREYHLPRTEVRIDCIAGYRRTTSRSSFRCNNDGVWENLENTICKPACDGLARDMLNRLVNYEVLVNFFRLTARTNNPKYEKVFNGTIISHKLVLTSAEYFRDTNLPNGMSAIDPTVYQLRAHELAYDALREQVFDRYNISQIVLSENPSLDGGEAPAIVVLVDYFMFKPLLKPICLRFSPSCLRETISHTQMVNHPRYPDYKGVAYLLDDCVVYIGKTSLILLNKYKQWIEMQITRYNYLL